MISSFTGPEQRGVIIELAPGQSIIAEKGAFVWGDDFIQPRTSTGGILGAIGRVLSGENIFQVEWRNQGSSTGKVAFAAPYTSKIDSYPLDGTQEFIVQKGACIASEPGVEVQPSFRINLGGIFGGEGLIMQKFSGNGEVFFSAGGDLHVEYLESGQRYKVDTGCIVGFEGSVNYQIAAAGGPFTAIFGGEGLVLATLTGPGHIVLQTHPETEIGRAMAKAVNTSNGGPNDGQQNRGRFDLSDGFGMDDIQGLGDMFGN